jgi:hypothetical protein
MTRRLALTTTIIAALVSALLSASGAAAAVVPATKVLIVVEENHSLAQMQAGMPYTYALAKQYGYATGYRAITHPSLPNYLAIAGGSTFGVTDDGSPAAHPLGASTVFGQALANGRTAKTYAESASATCDMRTAGRYAPKHNPWLYFTPAAERAGCRNYDVPATQFASDVAAGRLPTVGLLVPNLCNDAHDCSLATADAWFRQRMQEVFAGPDWKAGRLVVVLTADESVGSDPTNTVLTVVVHPSQQGHVVTTRLTHYSLTRLCEDVAHVPYLCNAATAPSLSAAFGLPIG